MEDQGVVALNGEEAQVVCPNTVGELTSNLQSVTSLPHIFIYHNIPHYTTIYHNIRQYVPTQLVNSHPTCRESPVYHIYSYTTIYVPHIYHTMYTTIYHTPYSH